MVHYWVELPTVRGSGLGISELHIDTAMAIHIHCVIPRNIRQGSLLEQQAVLAVHLQAPFEGFAGVGFHGVLDVLGP